MTLQLNPANGVEESNRKLTQNIRRSSHCVVGPVNSFNGFCCSQTHIHLHTHTDFYKK